MSCILIIQKLKSTDYKFIITFIIFQIVYQTQAEVPSVARGISKMSVCLAYFTPGRSLNFFLRI